MKWYDRTLLSVFLLLLTLFFWKDCQADFVQREIRSYFQKRIDSLEVLVKQKNSKIDSLISRLDSLKQHPSEFKPKHYETMSMPDFIAYLNNRYKDFKHEK